jgi:hypothetical protein
MKKLCEITIENSVDYEGKLNNHKDYVKLLDIIEKKCEFIGITSEHEIIEKFKKDIICSEKTQEWWGIWKSYEEEISFIKSSKEMFEYLKKYETFCKTEEKKMKIGDIEFSNYVAELTEFGFNDIAFYDKNKKILLRTNTHEGFIDISEEIHNEFSTNN